MPNCAARHAKRSETGAALGTRPAPTDNGRGMTLPSARHLGWGKSAFDEDAHAVEPTTSVHTGIFGAASMGALKAMAKYNLCRSTVLKINALVLALVLAPAMTSGAHALTPTPPESGFPAGAVPDILGISPGMNAAQVKELLNKNDLKGGEVQGGFTGQSAPFTVRIEGGRPDVNGLTVVFTFPPSGNQAVFLSRYISYQNTAMPIGGDVLEALVQKYGKPSLVAASQTHVNLQYFFKDGQKLVGPKSYDMAAIRAEMADPKSSFDTAVSMELDKKANVQACRIAAERMTTLANNNSQLLFSVSRDLQCDAIIQVVLNWGVDRTRLANMRVQIIDFKAIKSAFKIDNDALIAAEDAKNKRAPVGAPPKL